MFESFSRRLGHVESKLKPTPHCAVQQFRMVGRGHGHDITRKLVDLHEQKRYHALYFAGFVIVATLFSDGIELVKQEHAWDGPHIFEQAC